MLFSILRDGSMSGGQKLLMALIMVFAVLLSLSVHEMSHGVAAYWMGDKTAKYSGRLSLNPIAHLDPIGALCLFLFGFGWAKPVPVNPHNFNKPKLGMALTSLAGPISNFILAFIAEIGVVVLSGVQFTSQGSFEIAQLVFNLLYYLVLMNIGLGIFNLIPVPPLDGSKVVAAILPNNIYYKYMEFERFGFIFLIILINLPFFNQILTVCRSGLLTFFNDVIGLFL